jgi:hypothetical protein
MVEEGRDGGIFVLDTDLERVNLMPGDLQCPGKYVEHKRFLIKPEQIKYHGVPTVMPIEQTRITEIVLALAKCGYGWYDLEIITSPFVGKESLYNSHYCLGRKTPLPEQEEKARTKYNEAITVLEKGNFNLHVFSNVLSKDIIGLEELI